MPSSRVKTGCAIPAITWILVNRYYVSPTRQTKPLPAPSLSLMTMKASPCRWIKSSGLTGAGALAGDGVEGKKSGGDAGIAGRLASGATNFASGSTGSGFPGAETIADESDFTAACSGVAVTIGTGVAVRTADSGAAGGGGSAASGSGPGTASSLGSRFGTTATTLGADVGISAALPTAAFSVSPPAVATVGIQVCSGRRSKTTRGCTPPPPAAPTPAPRATAPAAGSPP